LAVLSIFVILAFDFSIWTFIWFVIIFAVCSILVGLLLLVPWLVNRRKGTDTQPRDQRVGDDNEDEWARTARLRYALLALAIWFALSIFLVLDVGFSVSVYLQFVIIYTLFWVLIGVLLLVGSPRRHKLLILGLLVAVLFSIRSVDWNSRKPFLKDLYHVKEGMTVEQVEQIMGRYMGGTCWPAHPLGLPSGKAAIETEELAQPDRLVYRHTDEGWGDSDWGEITFEKGRVVRTQFLPD
jgi:NADH:ubiquinone oxidoreductase subunit 3 (subunit A)